MVMEYTYEKQDATITGHIGKEYLCHMYMFLWGGGGEVEENSSNFCVPMPD